MREKRNFAERTKALKSDEAKKICFVVDRDKESFTEQQYDYVVERCQEKEFGLYITNPCFEFWLLLHFPDAIELDKERLRENPAVSAKRRYAESELRRRIPGYRKSKYDALSLVRKIDTALLNQKYFCQDISGLKTKVGSNIGTNKRNEIVKIFIRKFLMM